MIAIGRPTRRTAVTACLCAPFYSLGAEDTWLDKLSRIFPGIASAPGQMRGDDSPGTLWVADFSPAAPVRWTSIGGFRWPVFGADNSVYALKDEMLVRIPAALAAPVSLYALPGVEKLVGFDPRVSDELIVLRDDRNSPLWTISLRTGALAPLPFDPGKAQHEILLDKVRAQDRSTASMRIMVQTQRRQGRSRAIEWTDIIVEQGSEGPRNLSRCDGLKCSQPALSINLTKVVFVKSED